MFFNSLDFAVFLPIVFVLYWYVCAKKRKAQNLLIVLASYVFYGWWDWRFLSLIVLSSLVDYFVGIGIGASSNKKKKGALLTLSVVVNLGLLGFFKYYNFFLDNFITAFSILGSPIQANSLNIILPVGISFYTFQTLSYSIDVYKGKLKANRDLVSFMAFVSFFPQLVAGPIERATHLLPQFNSHRRFDEGKAVDGIRQILWGLFKKVVIADNCALLVDQIFDNYSTMNGSALVVGAVLFAFQIYGDFSGYSDIAIGVSRLFGFDLMQNFAFPYFSRDIAEFWRRWHISLSTWFRDYMYIPLGGSRGGIWMKVRNTFIIFLVSGFWHGANWTFIVWGALNAVYFLPLMLSNNNREHMSVVAQNSVWPTIGQLSKMVVTFILTCIAWVFFRSESLTQAFEYLRRVFTQELWSIPHVHQQKLLLVTSVLILVLLLVEWHGRRDKHALEKIAFKIKTRHYRWATYMVITFAVFVYSSGNQEFVYFQF